MSGWCWCPLPRIYQTVFVPYLYLCFLFEGKMPWKWTPINMSIFQMHSSVWNNVWTRSAWSKIWLAQNTVASSHYWAQPRLKGTNHLHKNIISVFTVGLKGSLHCPSDWHHDVASCWKRYITHFFNHMRYPDCVVHGEQTVRNCAGLSAHFAVQLSEAVCTKFSKYFKFCCILINKWQWLMIQNLHVNILFPYHFNRLSQLRLIKQLNWLIMQESKLCSCCRISAPFTEHTKIHWTHQ